MSKGSEAAKIDAGMMSAPAQAYVSEVFCSVQGEGPFVGERQVFLRTAGCTATCSWCDTVYSKLRTPRFVVHGHGQRAYPNPVSEEVVVSEVFDMARRENAHTVSVTGGEPLEQAAFVTRVARRLHDGGLRVYLETNGMHAQELQDILPCIDVVAMDIKLPSAIGFSAWEAHRAFLGVMSGTRFDPAVADGAQRLFVKIVVDPQAQVSEIERAVALIAEMSSAITLVLQPESGSFLASRAPTAAAKRMFDVIADGRRAALRTLADVRVIPQCHKILKVR